MGPENGICPQHIAGLVKGCLCCSDTEKNLPEALVLGRKRRKSCCEGSAGASCGMVPGLSLTGFFGSRGGSGCSGDRSAAPLSFILLRPFSYLRDGFGAFLFNL